MRIVEAIVADGPCGARDAAIGPLVRAVTVSGAGEEAFRLAKETFSALRVVDMNEDDRVTLLSAWVRAAFFATSLAAELDLRNEGAGTSHVGSFAFVFGSGCGRVLTLFFLLCSGVWR